MRRRLLTFLLAALAAITLAVPLWAALRSERSLIADRNGSMQVHFDHYEETIIDTKTAITSLATGGSLAASYGVTIMLVEA